MKCHIQHKVMEEAAQLDCSAENVLIMYTEHPREPRFIGTKATSHGVLTFQNLN